MSNRQFGVGNWVEVRSKEEILQTLDQDGRLDGMPFMPEMLGFCGKRFQVYKSAHKTCDTVFPLRSRRVDDTVHLQTRCNGQSHGGCQAANGGEKISAVTCAVEPHYQAQPLQRVFFLPFDAADIAELDLRRSKLRQASNGEKRDDGDEVFHIDNLISRLRTG